MKTHGYNGVILDVDLSSGKIEKKALDPRDLIAFADSIGVCLFAMGGYGLDGKLMGGITGRNIGNPMEIGERIYNLEKLFNYREGFRRADDVIPDRFFEEPLTVRSKKGAVLTREQFDTMMDAFYKERDWDPSTTKPSQAKLESLGLVGAEYSI